MAAEERIVSGCLIIIGDEILSGRTVDANLSFLARRLNEVGVLLTEARVIPDDEETIVATETLPIADWRRAAVFSWMVMLMHSLKAGFFIMGYLARRFGLSHTGFIRFIAEARMAPIRAYLLALA